MICEFRRLSRGRIVCGTCALELGALGPSDCPRIREPYGRGALVDLIGGGETSPVAAPAAPPCREPGTLAGPPSSDLRPRAGVPAVPPLLFADQRSISAD